MDNYVVIVAHPDDETLFFSSALKDATSIIICFGPAENQNVTAGRQQVAMEPPLPNMVFLEVAETGASGSANWDFPVLNRFGITVRRNSIQYQKTYALLKEKLGFYLSTGITIYTHNPWGEYGHEEHILVHNAVYDLAQKFSNKVYVNTYVSDKSFHLFESLKSQLSPDYHVSRVPLRLCKALKDCYINHNCWTWNDNYKWPRHDFFTSIDKNNTIKSDLLMNNALPIQYFTKSFKAHVFVRVLSSLVPRVIKKLIRACIKGK